MTIRFVDGFNKYGSEEDGRTRMLDGVWAELTNSGLTLIAPTDEITPRSGTYCLRVTGGSVDGTARFILPASETEMFLSFGLYVPELPSNNNTDYRVAQFCDNANATLFTLSLATTGDLILRSGATGSIIVQTQTPAIVAGTWQHLEMRIVIDAATGVFNLFVDETEVIDGTGLNLGSTAIAQLRWHAEGTISVTSLFYIADLVMWDADGAVNNTFMGDVRVATLVASGDDDVNWTPRYRKMFGAGVLDLRETDAAVSAADSADFEFGSGDYTVEGSVRFLEESTVTRQIIGKWQTSGNQRSWTLELTGSADPDPNLLRLLCSTDGSAETIIHEWPWQPSLYRTYHIAVSRDTAVNRLFIDGVIQGTAKADANTYFANTAALAIGARMSSSSAVVAGTGMGGFMDEVRITKGVGRYTGNFTPETEAFGRDVGADPDFASVTLLAGFDASIADESGSPHTLTARNSAAVYLPTDGAGAYTAINNSPPVDDTVIEAALVAASGILTPSDNPTATESVTIDGQAYTFVDVLVLAYDVLIGATLSDTLDNLVAAINDSGGEGTTYGTGTDPHPTVSAERLPDEQIRVTALTAGTTGNSITTTETIDGVWENGATLTGGEDIPDPSTFSLSRLPPETTTIKAISVSSRQSKTDAGAAKTQLSFVGPGAAEDAGTERSLTVDPTYYDDIFEVDPDTSGPITPATLFGGLIKIDRTE